MLLKLKYLLHLLRFLSFRKVSNYFQLYLSYRFSVSKPLFKTHLLPAFISVEPTNVCQLQCPECPVGLRHENPKNAIQLNEATFRKTIDELKSKLLHVIFYFQGEPLLNKNVSSYINYAHQNKIYTSTSTNAQSLNPEFAKSLVLSGLDKLIISIDGSTQEVYEKYRVGGKLQKAIDGVKYVQEWKQKFKSVTPIIEIQFVVFKTNEHQLDDMRALAKELKVERIVFKTAQLYDFENGHPLLTSIEKYARYKLEEDGKYHIKSELPNRCLRLWTGAVINSKGDLVPCCFDKDSEHSFGNVGTDSFASTWHNKKASDFRGSILKNRKQYEMCRNCTSK